MSRTLNEPDGLSNSTSAVGWHVYCAWYFTMCFVQFESTVVTFDSGVVGLEINMWYLFWKCEKLVFVPLQKFIATSQTLSLRHPDSAIPVTHLFHNASGWQVPGQVALSGKSKSKSKSKSKKTLFSVGQCKQYNISSHLKWVLVAYKSMHMIIYNKIHIKSFHKRKHT